MENTDINISDIENIDIDELLRNAIKEKIENGKYKMDLKTKYGEIKQLNVPRDRESNFHTKVIEPYNRSIGMEDLIVSMYSNGISTRRIAVVRTIYYLDSYQMEYIEIDKYKLEYNEVI